MKDRNEEIHGRLLIATRDSSRSSFRHDVYVYRRLASKPQPLTMDFLHEFVSVGAFHHPHFRQGRKDLCHLVTRPSKVIHGRKSKKQQTYPSRESFSTTSGNDNSCIKNQGKPEENGAADEITSEHTPLQVPCYKLKSNTQTAGKEEPSNVPLHVGSSNMENVSNTLIDNEILSSNLSCQSGNGRAASSYHPGLPDLDQMSAYGSAGPSYRTSEAELVGYNHHVRGQITKRDPFQDQSEDGQVSHRPLWLIEHEQHLSRFVQQLVTGGCQQMNNDVGEIGGQSTLTPFCLNPLDDDVAMAPNVEENVEEDFISTFVNF